MDIPKQKILIVDDEKGLRLGTKRLLEKEGFEVVAAENGTEGIAFGTSTEFDAAIRRIVAYPKSYALLGSDIRRCLIKRFPYGVLYGIDTDTIVIVAVAHLHRKPNYWIDLLG